MKNEKQAASGEGLRSLKTSNLFRVVNFELYAKPVSPLISRLFQEKDCFDVRLPNFYFQNKAIMALGIVGILGCSLYIMYMRKKYEGMGYYAAVAEDGTEYFEKKKSKWD